MYSRGCKNWMIAFNNPRNSKELRKEYTKLAETYHPDLVGENEEFKEVTVLYAEGVKYFKIKDNKITNTNILEVRDSYGHGFDFNYITDELIDSCRVFTGKNNLCFKFIKENKVFYDNYLKMKENIRYPNDKAKEALSITLPNVIKTFEDATSYYIVLRKTEELVSLNHLLTYYNITGTEWKDKYRHAVWIINRCYGLACLMEYNSLAFNGFNTRNIYISPSFHTVSLLNGWQFCTKIGNKMIGTTKDIYDIMPIKVKDSKLADSYTDLESIKQIGRCLFEVGSPKEFKSFREFFERASRKEAVEDWQEFRDIAYKIFGKPKFIMLDIDNLDILLKISLNK